MDPKSLERAALAGDRAAQYALAERYRLGDGLPSDLMAAFRWYKAAAEQGLPEAQNDLGSMYRNGLGVAQDDQQAFHWYGLAAKSGHRDALFNLGKSYLHGMGTEINYGRAYDCFTRAGKKGDTAAISELGTMHRFGHGCARSIEMAATFHVIAALEGDVVAMGNLADYRDELESLALTGNQSAAVNVAKMYDRGLGVDRDQAKALAWLDWATKNCTPDNDEDLRAELAEWHSFYTSCLAPDIRKEARSEYTALKKRLRPSKRT